MFCPVDCATSLPDGGRAGAPHEDGVPAVSGGRGDVPARSRLAQRGRRDAPGNRLSTCCWTRDRAPAGGHVTESEFDETSQQALSVSME